MGKNKIIYGGQTLLDLSSDTVTPASMLTGVTAHNRSGEPITGTLVGIPAYTGTPEMDGEGDPGVANAYARGDHVHPSDTAKMDKIPGAVTGHFAVFDTNGGVNDSGLGRDDLCNTTATIAPNVGANFTMSQGGGMDFRGFALDTHPSSADLTVFADVGEASVTVPTKSYVDEALGAKATVAPNIYSDVNDFSVAVEQGAGSAYKAFFVNARRAENGVTIGTFNGDQDDITLVAKLGYVDSRAAALQTQIDALGEPFRVKNWAGSNLNVQIPCCTEDIGNTSIPKMTFTITGQEAVDYQVVGMIAYEVKDTSGQRLNCWPVCQFTGSGQTELSVRWMCGGTTRKTAASINAWVLLKHR